jgi:hypothetical protein
MKLLKLDYYLLRGNEMLQCLTQLVAIVKGNDPQKLPKVAATCTDVEGFIPLLTELISKDAQSALTEKIVEADALRDQHIIGISEVLTGFGKHFQPDKAGAGILVLRVIDKHGKVADLSYNAETAAVHEIIDEIAGKKELKDAVLLLGINDWFDELKKSNEHFNALYLSRVDENATEPQGNVVDTRKAATVACKKMMDTIQSAANLNDTGDYDVLITKLNELVHSYKDLLAHREGVAKKSTNTPK